MSNDAQKAVKGATKSKHAPPKAKYIDPIISSSFSSDGSFHDVCRALSSRLKDPNSTIVFKSLIVVHTLVRAGNQETVLGYLSGTKVLGLEQVVGGYDIAQNLSKYASYLDRRIRTYGALKYDIIRDKGERKGERDGTRGCNRLRHLTVDKGLLRETTLLQKEMDSLAECKFYLDDTDDDLTMTALRMLVKDLLMLFQAVNEGVINVLEHYFEMSHPDASTALKIYKRFCSQTENVVTFLGVAKKLQNILNVPIPNLKHAPVSLAGSLEEYLKDPNFEANREEYKENKRIADGRPPSKRTASEAPPAQSSKPESKTEAPAAQNQPPKSFTDFFASIEQEQASMFNPQTGSPTATYFQQQAAYNPFLQQGGMGVQMTGYPGPSMQLQQVTGMPTNGFQQPQPQMQIVQPQATGYNPFLVQQPQQQMIQPQMTGFAPGGLLQAQPTSYNPFRQSMIAPSHVSAPVSSMPSFSSAPNLASFAPAPNPFQQTSAPSAQPPATAAPSPFARPVSTFQPTTSAAPLPTSTPKPLFAQPTGSRNPFAPPPGTTPFTPTQPDRKPTLNDLARSAFERSNSPVQQQAQVNGLGINGTGSTPATSNSSGSVLQPQKTGGLMSTLASSFAVPSSSNGATQSASAFAPTPPPLSSSPAPIEPLTSQPTGFGGSSVKPFKPSSSFGASLAESLPVAPQPTGISLPSTSGLSSPPLSTGSTGFNPFRSSLLPSNTGAPSLGTQPTGAQTGALTSQPTGWAPGGVSRPDPSPSQFSLTFNFAGGNGQPSLI